jgi:hypothetical protein
MKRNIQSFDDLNAFKWMLMWYWNSLLYRKNDMQAILYYQNNKNTESNKKFTSVSFHGI